MRNFFLALLFVSFGINFVSGQCGVDTLINIPDNEIPMEFQLVVDGVLNDDLADPSQCVKLVTLHYDHNSRHELTIDLVSPSGQKVGLVGPFVSNTSLLTGYIEWDISFVPDSDLASPDDFQKSDHFNNNDNWLNIGSAYNGVYYPNNGSLEDFNTGSVNGSWTFVIHDHDEIYDGHFYGASIEFCDGSSVECDICRADAGYFAEDEFSFCEDDPNRFVDLDVLFDGDAPNQSYYNHDYLIYKNNVLVGVSNNPNLDTLSFGSYKICGMSYHKNDSTGLFEMMNVLGGDKFLDSLEVAGTPYCVDVTDTCISLQILQVANKINIDTSICYGDTLYFEGEEFYEEGAYYVSLPSYNCEKSYLIDLKIWNIEAELLADDNTIRCPEGFVTLTGGGYLKDEGMRFEWSDNVISGRDSTSVQVSSPGVYDFIVIGDNCSDTASIEVFIDADVPQLEFDLEDINCFSDTAELSVNSLNGVLDSVYWWDSDGNEYIGQSIRTANPGQYKVKAVSTNQCYVVETIEILVDTIKPNAILSANPITCYNDTSFIDFVSSDSLIRVEWLGLGQSAGDTFVLDSGWYKVEYQGANGCLTVDSIYVLLDTDEPEVFIDYDTLNCGIDSVQVSALSSDLNLDYLWVNPYGDSLYNQAFYTDIVGNYKYEITGQNGCKALGNFDIIIDTVLIDLSIPNSILYLNCDSFTRIEYTINDSFISLFWVGPADFYSIDTFPVVEYEGIYNLSIIGHNQCVNNYTFIVLGDSSFSDIEIVSDTINCIDTIANLSVEYEDSKNYTFQWEDSGGNTYTGANISVYNAGYYYVTVTDIDLGCERVFFTEVIENFVSPIIAIDTSNSLDCSHDSLFLSIEADIELESIHWTGDGVDSYNDSLKVTSPGIYYVEAISTSKCVVVDSIVIELGEYLVLSPDTFYLNCENDTMVELNLEGVSDNYDFKWIGPNLETSDPSPVVTESGLYKVVVRNGECIDSTEILVEYDFNPPVVDVEFDPVILCALNYSIIKANLDTAGLAFYSWFGPNGYESKNLIDTVYDEGQYRFYARGANGCESLFVMNIVKSPDYPEVSVIGDTMTCFNIGQELVVNAEIQGDYNFIEWTGPNGYVSNSLQSTVTEGGWYSVFVNNEKNCIVEDSVYVLIDTVYPLISVPDIDTITCRNDSVDISIVTNNPNNSFNWIGPYGFISDSSGITVDNGGEYILNVTGDNGCSISDTIEVPINKLKPYVLLKSKNLDGNNAKVTIDLSTSASDFSVFWTGPDGFTDTDEDITINVAGKYYVLLIDESNGCETEDSISIIWDTIPPNIFSKDYYLPCDTSVYLEMVVFSDVSNCEFYWTGPEDFYAVGSTVYTNIPGEYTITAKGPNGIYNQIKINVFDTPIYPEFDAVGDNLNCYADSSKIRAIGVDDDKSFEWIGPNGFYSQEKEFFAYEAGTYTLIVTGKNSCVDSFDLEISIDSIKPVIDVEEIEPFVCEDIQGRLKVNVLNDSLGVYSFSWRTPNGKILQGNNSKSPLIEGEGDYIVKVLNTSNGCFEVDSVFIESNVYSLDSAIMNIVSPTCYGYKDGVINIDSVFGGEAPYSYSLDNYWFSGSSSFNSKKAGEYKIYIKDKNGCKLDTNVVVPQGAQVQVALGADRDSIFSGDIVNLEAVVYSKNPIKEYYWTPDEYFDYPNNRKQTISLSNSVNITVEAVDDHGCSDVSDLWIRVKELPDVFIPNIFSPNNDDINDYFYMKSGAGVKNILKLMIYDRWGNKMYEKQNLRQNVSIDGWDGKCNGREVLSGVYVYRFVIELNNGEIINLTGDVTLTK